MISIGPHKYLTNGCCTDVLAMTWKGVYKQIHSYVRM